MVSYGHLPQTLRMLWQQKITVFGRICMDSKKIILNSVLTGQKVEMMQLCRPNYQSHIF